MMHALLRAETERKVLALVPFECYKVSCLVVRFSTRDWARFFVRQTQLVDGFREIFTGAQTSLRGLVVGEDAEVQGFLLFTIVCSRRRMSCVG